MELWASFSLSLRLKAGKGKRGPTFYSLKELFMNALTSVRCSSRPFVEQATSLAGLGLTRQLRVPECYLCFNTLLILVKPPPNAALQQHSHPSSATTEGPGKDALDSSCTEFGVTGCTPGLLLLHGQGLGRSVLLHAVSLSEFHQDSRKKLAFTPNKEIPVHLLSQSTGDTGLLAVEEPCEWGCFKAAVSWALSWTSSKEPLQPQPLQTAKNFKTRSYQPRA